MHAVNPGSTSQQHHCSVMHAAGEFTANLPSKRQVEADRLVLSSAGVHKAHTEEAEAPTAEQSLTSTGTQPTHVKTLNFYGRNRQLLIDQRVAHLRANVQQRLRSNTSAPFEPFSLQRHAFAWAAEHELAADLR